jgi:hypothetical protein
MGNCLSCLNGEEEKKDEESNAPRPVEKEKPNQIHQNPDDTMQPLDPN